MRLFGSILTIIVFSLFGFVGTIVALLSGNDEFYGLGIPIMTFGIIVIIILAIYGQLKKKVPKICAIGFVGISAVSIMGFEGYHSYLRSLEVVSTQDVNLSEYRPFVEETKAVSLDNPSTFKIKDNLPKLDGATALYPVYSSFVQAVYPKKEYPLYEGEVVSSQTNGAFDRLMNGEVDIIFMAHPSEEQMNRAERLGKKLTLTPIGREAFVFFVHSKNPVDQLSLKQILGIYSGEITNWEEVGGSREEIRAFQRPEGSGSQTTLKKFMGSTPLMDAPSEDIVSAMGGIIRETTNYQNRKNAIGFSFRHFSQEMVHNGKIKNIAVEGVLPTKENIQNNTYPIVAEFYAITADSKNPHIETFINWMLSKQGQKIVDLSGYVPLN
ncbi:PstS family phosphate ABC transporter substrate-binding protein [Neobacillus sp. D3-1R]|uniref:PstS family phosphate ABC transporter substrate-binding protein n=1 Tax=Neobacillus sp. D3-1R TaxID=3445778 RepID=UPI003FA02050